MMLKQITPIVPVANLSRSIEFFTKILRFDVGFEQEGYAYIHRDNVGLSLINAAPDVDTHDSARQQSCYIDVDNLDELYDELRPGLETLPPERLREPFDQSYGQREFHVIDEDSLLIFFGEKIQASE